MIPVGMLITDKKSPDIVYKIQDPEILFLKRFCFVDYIILEWRYAAGGSP